jgi:hypothetical protein
MRAYFSVCMCVEKYALEVIEKTIDGIVPGIYQVKGLVIFKVCRGVWCGTWAGITYRTGLDLEISQRPFYLHTGLEGSVYLAGSV